ncbi:MAG: putative toxin-antitoxin system toxin component, PIN family [Bacteroidales bacterium]|nr:putative toxin-antitoxin system toxin component, PIN family [Bacteroidales bacterium]
MERIVLDTNCLIQILPHNSPYRHIWDKIISGEIVLCVSTEILFEYREILAKFFGSSFSETIMMLITKTNCLKVTPQFYWSLITQDPDDNKYVDCAIAANARCIVSNDSHFKVLKHKDVWPKVDVKTLKQYHKYWIDKIL